MHGVAYDEVHDLIIAPAQFSQSILVFKGDAAGEQPPLRVIQGPRTQIRRADRVAVDPLRKEIFVGDGGQVLVFPTEANGDVVPIRAIRGPDTRLDGGGVPAIAVDPVNKVLLVARNGILIFDSTADGNVKPLRVITGGGAGSGRAVAAHNGLVFGGSSGGVVGVWNVNDNGDVAPRFRIGAGVLLQLRGIAIDARNQTVILTDKELNSVISYYVPEVFAPDGPAAVSRSN